MTSNSNTPKKLIQNIDERLLGILIASVKDYAIFMLDPHGYVISWNKGAENIKGYAEKEIIGKHLSVFYTPTDLEKEESQRNLNEALKKGSYQSEGWRVRKDGSKFWADVTFTPLFDDDQKLLGFAKVTRDITERKKEEDRKTGLNAELERRIKENTGKMISNELLFRALIENTHDGIVLLDKNKRTIFRSKSAERINGWATAELEQKGLTDLVHPDDKLIVANQMQAAMSRPRVPVYSTYRLMHKQGNYIWVECLFTNMLDDPNIKAIVSNFRDVTEKKKADLLLQKTNNELFAYKYALDESAIVAITDQKGIIKHVNDNFCQISKYRREELIGQDHRIINSGYHNKSYIRNLWVTIAHGQIWKGELKNRTKDGSFYWVDTTIVPFLDEAGKPYQYVAIRSDITERKLAEADSKKKADLIQDLLENLTDGFIALDENMCYLYANTKIRQLVNKDSAELIGKNVWDVFPEAIATPIYHAMNVVLKDKKHNYLVEFNEKLGLWLENRIYPSGGGISMFISDITKNKREEQHLRLLESVITNTTDAVLITEAEPLNEPGPRIVYVNDAFTKMTGYSSEEVIGKTPRILQGAKTDKLELARLSQALHLGMPFELTTINYKRNGQEFWMNAAMNPVTNAEGKCTHFIAIERDITERKTSEIHLRELNESLQRHAKELAISNAELEQFAYVASHDLQEPLRMVTSFLTQLEKKYSDIIDAKGKQYIYFAVDGAKRMRQIILDLLEFSRVGRTEDDIEQLNFNQLLTEITLLYKRQIEELGANIIFKNLPTIQTYKTPMRQAFLNLISNGLKYHKSGRAPIIEISCKETNAYYQFSIKDNGIGIDTEYFDKIFIIFQRLHNKEQYSGTGMGLAITKKIIENLGGKIWVESEIAKGSTFYFTVLKNLRQ